MKYAACWTVAGLAFAIAGSWVTAEGGLFRRNKEEAQVENIPAAAAKATDAKRATGAGDFRRELKVGGEERYYLCHVPKSYQPGRPMPLILAFHGGGGNPERMRETTGFDKMSEDKNFIVVYPAGTGDGSSRLSWNILLSDTYATEKKVDDIAFVKAALKDVESLFSVDPKRVYATGLSQGAMLCYRLICDQELSGRLAAIAPVSGVMTVDPKDCDASRPVPIMHFHGKKDSFCPYDGGVGDRAPRNDRVPRPSVAETIKYWQERNKVPSKSDTEERTGQALRDRYANKGDAEVILWTLEDGGHTWPGGVSALPEFLVGKVNRDISASDLMWTFFAKHKLP